MYENLLFLVLLYMLLELSEIQWQRADSMMGMLLRMYRYYRKSILLFFLMHPTYYFAIWLAMTTDYSIAALGLLFIKTLDIATKILLIQQVFEKRRLSQELSLMLLTPLHPLLPYLGLFIYTPLALFALIG